MSPNQLPPHASTLALQFLLEGRHLDDDGLYVTLSETTDELNDVAAVLDRVGSARPACVVFDSLSKLRVLARDPLRYRWQILGFKNFFFTSPEHRVAPRRGRSTEGDLRREEAHRRPRENSIRELKLGPDLIQLGESVRQFQGILTGVPQYIGAPQPLLSNDQRTR